MRASPHTLMIPISWVYGIGFAFRDTQIPICLGAALRLGRPTFLVIPQCRGLLYCNSLVFCFDTRSIPKDSRLEGQRKPTMMEQTISAQKPTKKKDVWKNKRWMVWFRELLTGNGRRMLDGLVLCAAMSP